MKSSLSQIDEAMGKIRDIQPDRVDDRRKVFEESVRPAVVDLQNLTHDFVGQNSQFFLAQN